MHADFAPTPGLLYAFLLVLARVGGAFVLVPMPHMRAGTESARIIAALALTIALLPLWPHFESFPDRIGPVVVAVFIEAGFGLAIGLAVALFNEILQTAAQLMSLQAGFSYASTIDPSTAADSGLLMVIAQLMGGLLFFSLGLDREVIRVFAESLTTHPPGVYFTVPHLADALWHFAADLFTVGLRLALPAIALLSLVDLSLALMARINSHLQLISVSFPIKMLASLVLLAVIATLYPRVITGESEKMIALARYAAGVGARAR